MLRNIIGCLGIIVFFVVLTIVAGVWYAYDLAVR